MRKKAKVYKFRNYSDQTIEALKNNYFFAATPEKMNDVFELKYKSIYDEYIEMPNEYAINTTYHEADSFERHKSIYRIGMYCLAKSFNSPLLWALYANAGRGFVIAYDYEKLITSTNPIDVFDINYTKKNAEDLPFNEELSVYQNIFGTKHISFKYENEHRLIFDPCYRPNEIKSENLSRDFLNSIDARKIAYHTSCISEIIFGWKMTIEEKNMIQEIFSEDKVIFSDAVFGMTSYDIVRN